MLDKLMNYAEKHREYESGFAYGSKILRLDRASERTHRHLMLLQYMAGDRTAALRQYERCVTALQEELDVKPQRRTTALYEQIRADGINNPEPIAAKSGSSATAPQPEILSRLRRLQLVLAAVQKRVQLDIKAVEQGVKTTKQ